MTNSDSSEPRLQEVARIDNSSISSSGCAIEPQLQASEPSGAEDAVGAAEAEVGRYVYRRIEALMDAKAGTPEGAELAYLARVTESVEEWGEEACGGSALATFQSPAEAAANDLLAVCKRLLAWLVMLAEKAEQGAADKRFLSLAAAHAADARNYRATAADVRAAIVKALGAAAASPEGGPSHRLDEPKTTAPKDPVSSIRKENGASVANSGGTASPRSDGQQKSEGAAS